MMVNYYRKFKLKNTKLRILCIVSTFILIKRIPFSFVENMLFLNGGVNRGLYSQSSF